MRVADDTAPYEGLIATTTSMFHGQVHLEFEDMRQELRLTVIKARRAYQSKRSQMKERAFVYGCVANRVKDMKRDAARRANGRLVLVHVGDDEFDWFEFTFRQATHDEVFGCVEDAFVLPATITEDEQKVLKLLVLDYSQVEIAGHLNMNAYRVKAAVKALREKLRDSQELVAAPQPVAA